MAFEWRRQSAAASIQDIEAVECFSEKRTSSGGIFRQRASPRKVGDKLDQHSVRNITSSKR